ncbi:MAG: alanine racemase [Rhizobiaceae bacterium]|nr:alanine racemase [Rhizobiaceae bacterium]
MRPPATPVRPAGAILTIDLAALRANYRLLRERLGGAECGAVVKANAYGLGVEHVAPALRREGCRTFFVAHLSEGVRLREVLGPDPTIYVLNGLHPGAEAECAELGLLPVLNSDRQVAAWRHLASTLGRCLPAALQVDSGMARLGMSRPEIEALSRDPSLLDGIEVRLAMSHLARADEPGEPANAAQLKAFEALSALLPKARRALANSSGIFLGGSYHFDLARPGAALYGINPQPGRDNPMRPVVRIQARVIQTRIVEPGEGIGYGHRMVAPHRMKAATISLGYADGWHRCADSAAWFDSVRLPFAGRVSMDSIVLDASAAPHLEAGDLVEMIGGDQSLDDVARQAGTIGYEVLTSLGTRFQRIFLDD